MPRCQRQLAQLPACPKHNRVAIRRPIHIRIHASDCPGFLHILVKRVINFAVFARGQIAQIQLRLRRLAPHIGEFLTIGRWGRAHRTTLATDDLFRLAGLDIIAFDGENLVVRILRIFKDRPRCRVAGEPDMLAVGVINRLAQFLLMRLAGLFDQRHASAARHMIQPDFAGAQGPLRREMLFRCNKASIGAPACLIGQAEILFG